MSDFDLIPDDVKQNYRDLAAQRGWSLETAAASFETRDSNVAAWLRSEAAPARSEAPKGRRSKGVQETAD